MTDEEKRYKAAMDNTINGRFRILNERCRDLWSEIKKEIRQMFCANK